MKTLQNVEVKSGKVVVARIDIQQSENDTDDKKLFGSVEEMRALANKQKATDLKNAARQAFVNGQSVKAELESALETLGAKNPAKAFSLMLRFTRITGKKEAREEAYKSVLQEVKKALQ